jgi:hypothetical protein
VRLGAIEPVDEAGGQREADIRDAVDGFQPGLVVALDLDAARAQFGHLSGDVVHSPRGLGPRLARTGGAAGDHEAAVAPQLKVRKSSLSISPSSPIRSP